MRVSAIFVLAGSLAYGLTDNLSRKDTAALIPQVAEWLGEATEPICPGGSGSCLLGSPCSSVIMSDANVCSDGTRKSAHIVALISQDLQFPREPS